MDFFKKTHNEALVSVNKPVAVLVALMNCFFPGSGTLVACIIADKAKEGIICFAMMWLMTFVFFIGWVWSIVHGVQILMKSFESNEG